MKIIAVPGDLLRGVLTAMKGCMATKWMAIGAHIARLVISLTK